jgi:hypothetical protein
MRKEHQEEKQGKKIKMITRLAQLVCRPYDRQPISDTFAIDDAFMDRTLVSTM